MYKVEIHCSLDNIDFCQTPFDYPSWNVVCFIKNQKLICGRYSTPIEAGKAAQEMDSFFKFLSPDLKEKLKQNQN